MPDKPKRSLFRRAPQQRSPQKRAKGKPKNTKKLKTKLNEENLVEALDKYHGNLSAVARHFNLRSRTTLYAYINDNDLWAAVEDSREVTKDKVENALIKKAIGGHPTAMIFYLKTQARERGYIERVDNRNVNVDVDFSKLSNQQLERIAAGEDIAEVIADE